MNRVGPLGLLGVLLILLAACGGATKVSTAPATFTATANEPAGLSIPAIGVDVKELDTFGLDNKGNYACPEDPQSAAWNRGGTVPGEPGLALIVASARGVFKRLGEVKPGDTIYISRTGASRLTFKAVDATTQNSDVELQLAGCDGGTGRAVYAELSPS